MNKSKTEIRGATTLDWIAIALVSIGGLNWLLVGAFQFDLVAALFGEMTALSRAVYVLVGLAAIYMIVAAPRMVRRDHARLEPLTL